MSDRKKNDQRYVLVHVSVTDRFRVTLDRDPVVGSLADIERYLEVTFGRHIADQLGRLDRGKVTIDVSDPYDHGTVDTIIVFAI